MKFSFYPLFVAKSLLIVWGTLPKTRLFRRAHGVPILATGPRRAHRMTRQIILPNPARLLFRLLVAGGLSRVKGCAPGKNRQPLTDRHTTRKSLITQPGQVNFAQSTLPLRPALRSGARHLRSGAVLDLDPANPAVIHCAQASL